MYKTPLLIFLILFLGLTAFSAFGIPSPGNISAPLTQTLSSNGTQVKRGSLSVTKMTVGDRNASNPSVANLTSNGKLGLNFSGSDLNSNPVEALDVHGGIHIAGPAELGAFICADSTGALSPCGSVEFKFDGKNCAFSGVPSMYNCGTTNMNAPYITKEFKVPTGVNVITVELWGAGGAGYGLSNSTRNYSPDSDVNYSSTCGSGTYACIIGGSASFMNGGATLLRAKGGYGATSAHTGASGGGYDIASGITSIASVPGASGGNGDAVSGTATVSYNAFFCGTTSYNIQIPVGGGDGGIGGKSGSGSSTPGGKGGHAGSNLMTLSQADRCAGMNTPQNGKGYLGENGRNGIQGSGGSGAGGKGGKADQNINTLCGTSCTPADQGYAGGGGGGYVKATVSVTPGTIYTVKLSHGGDELGGAEGGSCILNFYKTDCTFGASSGNGSHSYAQITY